MKKKYYGNIPALTNEFGLYKILYRSNKPLAEKFQYKISILLKELRLGKLKLFATENSLLK